MRRPLIAALITALTAGAAAALAAAAPAQAAAGVSIVRIQFDAPGTDTSSNTSVNGEYVVLKNSAASARTITGWTLRDAQAHVYTFPATTIAAGRTLVVRSGRGTNSSTTRYWGSGYHIWNNTGDTAYLRNGSRTLVDSCRWTSRGAGYLAC